MMAGSLLAIIMMTQGDGAKLFKACSTRTHMGGAPSFFFNLIMLMHVGTNDDGTLALPMNEQIVSSFV
jgi:hypothetical protein